MGRKCNLWGLIVLLLGVLSLGAPAIEAQSGYSVKQLVEFISSSIKLGHDDGRVARYLRDVQLSERLEDNVVESLRGMGAGPKTVQALERLEQASASLPLPGADAPAPPTQTAQTIPPPSPEDQQRIIEEVRQYALNYTTQLPNYLCLQVTRRYGDQSGVGDWRLLDTVTARVSYFDEKEEYKVILVDNRPVDMDLDQLGGSTSSGEFGTMLHDLFDPQTQAEFHWERWGLLRGRKSHVYSYRVRQSRSKWGIVYEKTDHIVPGYHGLVYVDEQSQQVVRMTVEADGIPPTFPIQQAREVLDYDNVEISGQQHMLPLKFQMNMRSNDMMVRNDVEFRRYQKFATDAVITFDSVDAAPDALPDDATSEQPVESQQ